MPSPERAAGHDAALTHSPPDFCRQTRITQHRPQRGTSSGTSDRKGGGWAGSRDPSKWCPGSTCYMLAAWPSAALLTFLSLCFQNRQPLLCQSAECTNPRERSGPLRCLQSDWWRKDIHIQLNLQLSTLSYIALSLPGPSLQNERFILTDAALKKPASSTERDTGTQSQVPDRGPPGAREAAHIITHASQSTWTVIQQALECDILF